VKQRISQWLIEGRRQGAIINVDGGVRALDEEEEMRKKKKKEVLQRRAGITDFC
jgi:hypothetical protein